MPEPDFHGLRDEVDRLVRQPDFDTVRQRAGRLRTRARVAAATGALGVLVALALGAASVLPFLRTPVAPAAGESRVLWAGGGDRNHLYAVLVDCATCPHRLVASTDGGRSWDHRVDFPSSGGDPVTVTVLGPKFLVARVPVGPAGKGGGETVRRISTDGGATWRDADPGGTPRAAAVPDTRLWGCLIHVPQGCDILVPDPGSAAVVPLATQPPLDAAVPVDAPPAAGYWVRGCDPATGRRAVAVSRTGGRSWQKMVFDREPEADRPVDCAFDLATTDGSTVFATLSDGQGVPRRVYRSVDGGGTWQAADPRLPDGWVVQAGSTVTADGTHVLLAERESRFGLLTSRDGRTYAPLAVDGPVHHDAPQAVALDRWIRHDERTVYLSDDGLHWRPLDLG